MDKSLDTLSGTHIRNPIHATRRWREDFGRMLSARVREPLLGFRAT
jgi:hypothetical protein